MTRRRIIAEIVAALALVWGLMAAHDALGADTSTAFSSISGTAPINHALNGKPGSGYDKDNAFYVEGYCDPSGNTNGFRARGVRLVQEGRGWGMKTEIDLGPYDGIVIEGNGPGPLLCEDAYVPTSGESVGGNVTRWVNTDKNRKSGTLANKAGGSVIIRGVMMQGDFEKQTANLASLEAATPMERGVHFSSDARGELSNCAFYLFNHPISVADTATVDVDKCRGLGAGCITSTDDDDTTEKRVRLSRLEISCRPHQLIDSAATGLVEIELVDVTLPTGEVVTHRYRAIDGVVRKVHDSKFDIRVLGCVPMSDDPEFDNAPLLAPAFAGHYELGGCIYIPPGRWRIDSTLQTTHRSGMVIEQSGPGGGPLAEVSYGHAGETPGAFQFGGAESVFVWGGAPGGTMFQINSSRGKWINHCSQGQPDADSNQTITTEINYALGAGLAILIRATDAPGEAAQETDLDAEVPYAAPGGWTFEDACFRSISMAVRFGHLDGNGDAVVGNHADHCWFDGHTTLYWVEDAFDVCGPQAVQIDFDQITGIEVKRYFRAAGGGGVSVQSMRLQGFQPTLMHLCNNGVGPNTRTWTFCNVDCDGTLGTGFKWVNFGAISTYVAGSGADMGPAGQSAWHAADALAQGYLAMASVKLIGGSLPNGAVNWPKPFARLPASCHLKFDGVGGLVNDMIEVQDFGAGDWGGTGPQTLRPTSDFESCGFLSSTTDHKPENCIYQSSGEVRVIRGVGCFKDSGIPITDYFNNGAEP